MTQPRKDRAAAGGGDDRGISAPRGAPGPRGAPALGGVPMAEPPPVELRIPASSEYVRVVRLALTGVASRMAFTYNEVEDIKVAIAEACNNAILHASAAATDGSAPLYPTVLVTFRPAPRSLEICISDDGRLQTADLLRVARSKRLEPHGESANLPERGFGLLIIQTLMDEVELFSGPDGRTTLRMVKYIQTPRLDPRAA